MSARNQIKKNGGPIIAVSRVFYNSRDRQKYIGSVGELVADVCVCATAEGGMVASLYLHIGNSVCGGIPVAAVPCGDIPAELLCNSLDQFPDAGIIEGVDLADDLCDALNVIPDGGVLTV